MEEGEKETLETCSWEGTLQVTLVMYEIENAFHVRLVTCTSDIATTPIARRQTCSCNISS